MGGNVRVRDAAGTFQAADKINLTEISRSLVRANFIALFIKLNRLFEIEYRDPIWYDELFVLNGVVFNGSSEAFFDSSIPDSEFVKVKPVIGDIDITVPHTIKKQLWTFLNKIQGNKVTDSITYIGNNTPNYPERKAQINALFRLDDAGFTANIQVDFEFLPYGDDFAPTEFSKFAHSSHWQDMQLGFKGIHHKYLIRSLVGGVTRVENAAVITKTGKISSSMEYANGISISAFSVDHGVRRDAYKPCMIDGSHLHIDDRPVYTATDTADSVYESNPLAIGRIIFGEVGTDHELAKNITTFVGLIYLMKRFMKSSQIKLTLDKLMVLYWGPGAQELERNNPVMDMSIKSHAWSYIQDAFEWYRAPNSDDIVKLYYNKYRIEK